MIRRFREWFGDLQQQLKRKLEHQETQQAKQQQKRQASPMLPIGFNAVTVEQEMLTAEQFLHLSKTRPSIIKSSTLVLPEVGQPGFGCFLVRYTYPVTPNGRLSVQPLLPAIATRL